MTAVQVPTLEMHLALAADVKHIQNKLTGSFSVQSSNEKWFTRNQAIAAIGCSLTTLEALIRKGTLKTRREGPKMGKVMVEVQSIGLYMTSTGLNRDYIETKLNEAYYGN